MIDQMPDEVWLERPRWDGWGEYTTKRVENPRVHRVRYIRADLYEQVKAERDRLRAALERAREMAEDGKASACAMQVCEDIELIAQEALGHD